MSAPDIQADLRNAVITFGQDDLAAFRGMVTDYCNAGNAILNNYCTNRGIGVRTLSRADAFALLVAHQREYCLATDDWPLRYVCQKFNEDDGEGPELMSTIRLLHILESNGRVTTEQRVTLVRDWMRADEKLLHNWRVEYRQLFGEEPPVVQ